MKSFIKNILIFIFPVFLLVIIMELYLVNINSLYKEKVEGLRKHANKIEIIILGNSHATYGINPKYFSAYAYNLANVGQSIYFDKELIIKNLDNLKKLKYVFISLDYHSLYFSRQRGDRDVWSYYGNGIKHPSRNYIKYNISRFLFGYNPKMSFALARKDILNKWRYRNHPRYLDFDTEIGIHKTDTLTKGFLSFSDTDYERFHYDYLKARIKKTNTLINTSKEEHWVLDELDQLVTTLQKKEITPIFFANPLFRQYTLLLDTNIIKRNRILSKSLSKKYNVEFWDYSVKHDLIKSDFYNADHLNKKGAKKISKILNARLLEMVLVTSPE